MDTAKVTEVCASYAKTLRAMSGVKDAVRLPEKYTTEVSGSIPMWMWTAHLLFICEETPRLMEAGRVEKAMRWLGWLQGVLWATDHETLEDAKKHNATKCTLCGHIAAETSAQAYSGQYCCKAFGTSNTCRAYAGGGPL